MTLINSCVSEYFNKLNKLNRTHVTTRSLFISKRCSTQSTPESTLYYHLSQLSTAFVYKNNFQTFMLPTCVDGFYHRHAHMVFITNYLNLLMNMIIRTCGKKGKSKEKPEIQEPKCQNSKSKSNHLFQIQFQKFNFFKFSLLEKECLHSSTDAAL